MGFSTLSRMQKLMSLGLLDQSLRAHLAKRDTNGYIFSLRVETNSIYCAKHYRGTMEPGWVPQSDLYIFRFSNSPLSRSVTDIRPSYSSTYSLFSILIQSLSFFEKCIYIYIYIFRADNLNHILRWRNRIATKTYPFQAENNRSQFAVFNKVPGYEAEDSLMSRLRSRLFVIRARSRRREFLAANLPIRVGLYTTCCPLQTMAKNASAARGISHHLMVKKFVLIYLSMCSTSFSRYSAGDRVLSLTF